MIRLLLTTSILICTFVSLEAQHIWARQSMGSGPGFIYDMAVDPSANILITGNGENINLDTLVSLGGDGPTYVAKYDSAGNPIWATQISGKSSNNGLGVASDAVGNVYVCGEYEQTNANTLLEFGNGVTLNGNASQSVYLAAANSDGVFQWATRILATDAAGNQYITPNDIEVIGDYIYITGTMLAPVSIDGVTYNMGNTTHRQMFVAKYHTNGDFQWFKHTDPTTSFGFAQGDYLHPDHNGGFYVLGKYQEVTWDGDTLSSSSILSGSPVMIAHFDSDGNMTWHRWAYTSGSVTDTPHPAGVDQSGNIVWTIRTAGTTVIGSDSSFLSETGRYIVQYDINGNKQYIKPMYMTTGSHLMETHAIFSQPDGTTFMMGEYTGFSDILFGNASLPTTPSFDQWNFFVAYDANGNPLDAKVWADEYLDSFHEFPIAPMVQDQAGAMYIAGRIKSGSVRLGTDTLDQALQFFLNKLDPAGFCNLNTSIEDQLEQEAFNVFPNPADHQVFISYEAEKRENLQLQLRNLQGQLLHQEQVFSNSGLSVFELNTQPLPTGLYVVQAFRENQLIFREKVVIR